MPLSPKQRRFVEEYLVDLNATQAAIRAGYSASTAKQQGHRLLTHDDVQKAIAEAQAARSERTGITADRVLKELARIGFADIRKIVNWRANVTGVVEDPDSGESHLQVANEVTLRNADDLDDDTAAAIGEVSQSANGQLKVKLLDKRAALVDLGRHLGLFAGKAADRPPKAEKLGKKEQAARAAEHAAEGTDWGDDLDGPGTAVN